MKIYNSKFVSILISTVLSVGVACKGINSQQENKISPLSEKKTLTVDSDIFDIRSQIKMRWPVGGEEILIKALGNSDNKVLVDPALLASVLEAENIPDSDFAVHHLYDKANLLRQLIANPRYAQNLFYILAQYYALQHEKKFLPWIALWQLNKSYTPNLFLKQSDGLPYGDQSLHARDMKLGFTHEAYLPPKTAVYDFVQKVIARYKKYSERPDRFQGFEWIKQKFNEDFLNPYRIAPAHRAALELRGSAAIPEGIYAELYRKLVLLGAIAHDGAPTQKNLLRAILNSDYINRDLTAFKTALIKKSFNVVLSPEKAAELIDRCDEFLEQWKRTQDFFLQLSEISDMHFQKQLISVTDRDVWMEKFIKKFNANAVLLKRPMLMAQLGLPEKHALDSHFYEIFQKKFQGYLHNAPLNGPITSPFQKARYHPASGKITPHLATDIGADHGTPIRPIWNGKAKVFLNDPGYGNYIVITTMQADGDIYEVTYAHCSKILVPDGTDVIHGEVVALVGSTGYSSGPHLHIAVKRNGVPQSYDQKFLDAMKMSAFDRLVQFLSGKD